MADDTLHSHLAVLAALPRIVLLRMTVKAFLLFRNGRVLFLFFWACVCKQRQSNQKKNQKE